MCFIFLSHLVVTQEVVTLEEDILEEASQDSLYVLLIDIFCPNYVIFTYFFHLYILCEVSNSHNCMIFFCMVYSCGVNL